MTAQIEVIDINDNNNDNNNNNDDNNDVSVEAPTETSATNFVAPVEEVKQK